MEPWHSPAFWLGLAFVTFPLNFIIYGWNDYVDYETDRLNPRKDSFLFGARGNREELDTLPPLLASSQVFCYGFFVWYLGIEALPLFLALAGVLLAYNFPKKGFRNTPPLELFAQFGYLLIVPFSMMLNDTPSVPTLTYIYLVLFAIQSQLMGEVMDIEPDRQAQRHTTATRLGMRNTKLLIIGIVGLEVGLLFFAYGDYIFGGMLAAGLIWLLLDVFVIFKEKTYTPTEMKLFGWGTNLIAFGSMLYVWWSGVLMMG
jgi:4-hydroxybenzoate polyprenyltransferase